MTGKAQKQKVLCDHCGDECITEDIVAGTQHFCCNGCKMIYMLLQENGMEAYYKYDEMPGISQKSASYKTYDFLDDDELVDKMLLFREGGKAKINLHLPQIHCSSCLWLLENINKLNPGILSSKVNFVKKEAVILYDETETSLRAVVELLYKIGYEPSLNFSKLDREDEGIRYSKSLLYKLGLAGFVFGNIMLLSFPEYLGFYQASVKFYVGYINIALAIPVLVYSGRDYLLSAWNGLKNKHLNIDVPVALGMLTLFLRSVYEILSGTGEGYLDSFAGFVFFLLIGRWFQSFTYQALDFDRNYKSYFPISAMVKAGKEWITKSIDKIAPGDILLIKNQELIPADAIVKSGHARVDYSFVTGEADIIHKKSGEDVLAGGRQMGNSIEVLVKKNVDQSYLTQLWNEDTFKNRTESSSTKLINSISKYFTLVVICIAVGTMLFWLNQKPDIAFRTFTAVLIVACPCALALAIPFTYGNVLRILSRKGFYLRNIHTIEDVQDVDTVIFDKTGTITDSGKISTTYYGKTLTPRQKTVLRSASIHSSHPLSKAIANELSDYEVMDVQSYEDIIGQGFIAEVDGHRLKVGSSSFIFGNVTVDHTHGVFIEIDGTYTGYFKFEHELRHGIKNFISTLGHTYELQVLSGDTDKEKDRMQDLFGKSARLYFNQSPSDKLKHIKHLQAQGKNVMMIGDGLNDAGALKQSNVGIVISDDANNFSPACDGILTAHKFDRLTNYTYFLDRLRFVIYGAFLLAFLYNLIGLYFAVTGQLSPVIAAILMPLSSITVILYGVISSQLLSKLYLK